MAALFFTLLLLLPASVKADPRYDAYRKHMENLKNPYFVSDAAIGEWESIVIQHSASDPHPPKKTRYVFKKNREYVRLESSNGTTWTSFQKGKWNVRPRLDGVHFIDIVTRTPNLQNAAPDVLDIGIDLKLYGSNLLDEFGVTHEVLEKVGPRK